MILLLFVMIFLFLLFVGAPMYLVLLIPSITYVIMNPDVNIIVPLQKMFVSVNNFPLLAIPFFILAGNIMNTSSVTSRIFNFALAVVGKFRGGLGYVNILSSLIFSGMSGSAIADVAGLGLIEMKAMREAGYDEEFIIGITAASATIGPVIPPSIPFVIYAAFAGISTGAMFIGGILPGLIMAIILSLFCFLISRKKNYPREAPVGFRGVWAAFKKSWLALLMPVIIIGGIWTGWFTPTEAALVATIYALVIAIFVYKDIELRDLYSVLAESLKTILPVMVVIVGATLFTWVLSYEKLDKLVLNTILSLTDNKYIVIFIIIVFVSILGMFFDGIVAILLFVPISLPLCAPYGIHPIHLGIIITVTNMIGLLTPPVGMSLFVLSAIVKKPVMTVAKWISPWLIALYITLFILAMWEPVVMWLPSMLISGF